MRFVTTERLRSGSERFLIFHSSVLWDRNLVDLYISVAIVAARHSWRLSNGNTNSQILVFIYRLDKGELYSNVFIFAICNLHIDIGFEIGERRERRERRPANIKRVFYIHTSIRIMRRYVPSSCSTFHKHPHGAVERGHREF